MCLLLVDKSTIVYKLIKLKIDKQRLMTSMLVRMTSSDGCLMLILFVARAFRAATAFVQVFHLVR